MKQLIILGHSNGGIPILVDQATEVLGVEKFIVIKNFDLPDIELEKSGFSISFLSERDFDFSKIGSRSVQFGVHNCPAKKILFDHFNSKYGIDKLSYVSLIHPTSYMAQSAKVGMGAFVEPLTVITSLVQLKFGVTIKRSASIGHHSILHDFVCINPGAVVSGFVEVGEGTVIGSGAVISNNIKIGSGSLIGAGSVVTKDIPDGVIAFGNPCKVVRENQN
ncbi:MAG: hypothetical protein CL555_16085 [Algoriphagus sp.]|nr:hypothetical protein [Algoriphagus sp.]